MIEISASTEIVFTFHNTHGAIAGENALINAGIKVKVMALPSKIGAGCGLCLRVDEKNFDVAYSLLAVPATDPQGIYYKKIDGDGQINYIPASPPPVK